MAQKSGTLSKYDLTGIREDLSDIIYNVDPTETPVSSALSRVKATQTNHEWQTDTLASASSTNAQIEGDEFSYTAPSSTTRLGNHTQIFWKTDLVTGTARAVNTAGRKDELGYQVAKNGKEIKRDIEKSLLENNAKVAGNDSTARELAGFPTWLTSNTDFASDGADATGDGTDARTDGTQRAFTEAQVKSVLQNAYTNGANVDNFMAILGPYNRQVWSTFSGNATRLDRSEDEKLYASVRFYVSDFGEIQAVPNRFSRARDVLFIDPEFACIAELRPMQNIEPAKTGDADPRVMLTELTLVVKNEKAHGGVFDLTTS